MTSEWVPQIRTKLSIVLSSRLKISMQGFIDMMGGKKKNCWDL